MSDPIIVTITLALCALVLAAFWLVRRAERRDKDDPIAPRRIARIKECQDEIAWQAKYGRDRW